MAVKCEKKSGFLWEQRPERAVGPEGTLAFLEVPRSDSAWADKREEAVLEDT